ncbi:MAG TPA: aromatic amino acid transport family protein [Gammaproteobacteria bacterium]|nr:aromatic amino acid transport family protein [Gammaproteobacteria bacterium]
MDFKLIGCILLLVGTSIGAGMLALPIAPAQLGFVGAIIMLFGCWLVMTLGAFLLLEVNLWLPQNSNLISMAKATIGPIGQILSWITYLLLLYSLLCAYIAGGSDLLHNLLFASGIEIPVWLANILFTLLFGLVVYLGIRSVDYVNRGLMLVKMGAYILLVILLIPFISPEKLSTGNMSYLTSTTALTVTITSFGYATIIPSLRVYFAGNVHKLKTIIMIGSLIPLICYIIWDAAIMGVIPLTGEHGLTAILQSSSSTSDLVNTLTLLASTESIAFFTKLFTSICVVTSFLGVALCLADFLADGFQLEKQGGNGLFIHFATFLPPLIITLFFPNAFIKALEYAGIYCIILLIFLPAWMAWCGRSQHQQAEGQHFKVPGGKFLLAAMMIIAAALIGNFLLNL